MVLSVLMHSGYSWCFWMLNTCLFRNIYRVHSKHNLLVKMMADHQHVQMFINCVGCIWSCRISRWRKNRFLSTHLYYIWSMATTSTFWMIRMYTSPFKCFNGLFYTSRFIQSICVNCDLKFKVSEWLLFNSPIFHPYHSGNKLIFNEMMIKSALY